VSLRLLLTFRQRVPTFGDSVNPQSRNDFLKMSSRIRPLHTEEGFAHVVSLQVGASADALNANVGIRIIFRYVAINQVVLLSSSSIFYLS